MFPDKFGRALLLVFLALVWLEMPGTSLFDPDESRYAEVPREMLVRHDFITPHLNGTEYFEKPPLLYWGNAFFMSVFGENPYAVRMTTRLAATGTTLLLLFMLAPGTPWALWSALIFLSGPLPFSHARINITDGVLTFSMTLLLLSIYRLIQALERNEKTGKWSGLAGLGAGLAVLAKGPIGIVLPGGIVFLWSLLTRNWKPLKALILSWAPLIFLVVAVPWFYLVSKSDSKFLWFFFVHEHILRYATKVAKRDKGFYFLTLTFLWGFAPWVDPFVRSLKNIWNKFKQAKMWDLSELYFLSWFFVIFLFFSFSKSQLIPYLLPAFPAAAILAAKRLVSTEAQPRWWKKQLPFWAGLYLVLILALPYFSPSYSDRHLAQLAERYPEAQVVAYQYYPHSFPLYFKRPIRVADFKGELDSDNDYPREIFWDYHEFWTHWYSEQRMVVIMNNDHFSSFNYFLYKPAYVIGKSRRALLVTNFPPSL